MHNIDLENKYPLSPIHYLESVGTNQLYIKREDLLPFSFGGNKARKGFYFFKQIIAGKYTAVLTYGSLSSNHCRIISNLCAKHQIACYIVSPISDIDTNFNQKLINLANATVIRCHINDVRDTIQTTLDTLRQQGKTFFIPGGGHGDIGTQAYIDAYKEIHQWEEDQQLLFDYIFVASGTGSTQAGLILGQLLNSSNNNITKIIGISVARESTYGTQIIRESITEYFYNHAINLTRTESPPIYFEDQYIERSYGISNEAIQINIKNMYLNHGIALNSTYTGKAYTGMLNYIEKEKLTNKHILFIHTGGVPLFFDDLEEYNDYI